MPELNKHEIRDIYINHTLKAITLGLMILGAIFGYLLIDCRNIEINKQNIENKQIDLIIQITKIEDFKSQALMLQILEELYPLNSNSPAMNNFMSAIKKGLVAKKHVITEIQDVKKSIASVAEKIAIEKQKQTPDPALLDKLNNLSARLEQQKKELKIESRDTPIAVTSIPEEKISKEKVTVAIVIGHKKSSPGAFNENYMKSEFEYNEELSLLIEKALSELKISSKRIYRRTYRELPGDINAIQPSLMVNLHTNAFNSKLSGSSVMYNSQSENGKKLADILLSEIVNILNLKNRGIKPVSSEDRGGFLLHNVNCTAVILQPFFIDNDSDLKVAIEKKEELAQSIAKGIKKYVKNI